MSVIGKIIGYAAKAVRKAPTANIVSKVETNTAGRILRMQDAKYAFTVGKNYKVVLSKPMQNTSGINLVTKDNFAEKIAKMYPEGKSGALNFEDLSRGEKIDILRKRSDVRLAVEKYDTPVQRYRHMSLKALDNIFPRLEKPVSSNFDEFAKKIAKAKKNGNIGKIEMNSDDIFNFAKEMYLKK